MESVSVVPGLNRIPAGSDLFVGRADELERLDAAVSGPGGRAVVVALHGLGGVGKSTLAARFAELHADRFSPVWWVPVDSPEALETGLAELAVALAPETLGLPLEQRVELAIRWLATHEDWLLVLDNVTTPAVVAGLLGRVQTGTVVITSRQGAGWRGVRTVPLDVLPAGEAVDLLTRIVRAEWPDADLCDAERLCADLGWLPLAVEQAAAYLAQNRITPSEYLDLLARFPARLFTATADGGDAQRTMARVWHVTLDRLTDHPLTAGLLRVLAWWAPDTIPRGFLAGLGEEPDVHEALGRLAAHSMITLTPTTISLHRLVQAVTRTPDSKDLHRQPGDIATARDTATTILSDTLADLDPWSPADWPHFQLVLPHARAMLDYTTADTDTIHTIHLLNQLGHYLGGQGDTTITHRTRATQSQQRLYGPDHPDTLATRHNLAEAYRHAGDLDRAIPLLEVSVADYERILGADHPDTLSSKNNLANSYLDVGDLGQAVSLHEATLADLTRVLGADHPDTLSTRHNLAEAYRHAGDLDRAIPLFEAALADCERVLGADHPETLCSRNNLANSYLDASDLDRAIPLYVATLADRRRVLGPDHPNTLSSRNNLAGVYQAAGDLDRAIPMFEAVLVDCERVLGCDRAETLAYRNNLAGVYQAAGDLDRAIPMFEGALVDCERILGSDHPTTKLVKKNLIRARMESSRR